LFGLRNAGQALDMEVVNRPFEIVAQFINLRHPNSIQEETKRRLNSGDGS
jgi:hypothetical protein